jgi:hypothetical protein
MIYWGVLRLLSRPHPWWIRLRTRSERCSRASSNCGSSPRSTHCATTSWLRRSSSRLSAWKCVELTRACDGPESLKARSKVRRAKGSLTEWIKFPPSYAASQLRRATFADDDVSSLACRAVARCVRGRARLAERVGFEPTCPLRDKTLSRRPRYDHFGTSPQREISGAELSILPYSGTPPKGSYLVAQLGDTILNDSISNEFEQDRCRGPAEGGYLSTPLRGPATVD